MRSDSSCFGQYNRSCLLTYLLTCLLQVECDVLPVERRGTSARGQQVGSNGSRLSTH